MRRELSSRRPGIIRTGPILAALALYISVLFLPSVPALVRELLLVVLVLVGIPSGVLRKIVFERNLSRLFGLEAENSLDPAELAKPVRELAFWIDVLLCAVALRALQLAEINGTVLGNVQEFRNFGLLVIAISVYFTLVLFAIRRSIRQTSGSASRRKKVEVALEAQEPWITFFDCLFWTCTVLLALPNGLPFMALFLFTALHTIDDVIRYMISPAFRDKPYFAPLLLLHWKRPARLRTWFLLGFGFAVAYVHERMSQGTSPLRGGPLYPLLACAGLYIVLAWRYAEEWGVELRGAIEQRKIAQQEKERASQAEADAQEQAKTAKQESERRAAQLSRLMVLSHDVKHDAEDIIKYDVPLMKEKGYGLSAVTVEGMAYTIKAIWFFADPSGRVRPLKLRENKPTGEVASFGSGELKSHLHALFQPLIDSKELHSERHEVLVRLLTEMSAANTQELIDRVVSWQSSHKEWYVDTAVPNHEAMGAREAISVFTFAVREMVRNAIDAQSGSCKPLLSIVVSDSDAHLVVRVTNAVDDIHLNPIKAKQSDDKSGGLESLRVLADIFKIQYAGLWLEGDSRAVSELRVPISSV